MKNHECYIGLWLDYESTRLITLSELKEAVNNSEQLRTYTTTEYGQDFANVLFRKINILDYFDGRKNTNLCKFDYCPYCGNKIDYKKLKEEVLSGAKH